MLMSEPSVVALGSVMPVFEVLKGIAKNTSVFAPGTRGWFEPLMVVVQLL